MVVYFKKYTIAICAIAIALPVIVSTIWPLLFGQLMAQSAMGLISLILLFIVGLVIGYSIFERKAEGIAEEYIGKYNENCDPESFLSEGKSLADEIKFPYTSLAAWYMSYYAQALLDTGNVDEAKEIAQNINNSIAANKRALDKISIIANLIPLEEKFSSPDDVSTLIDTGLELCKSNKSNATKPFEDFFNTQKKFVQAQISGDNALLSKLSEKIRSSAQYPMRIRVEYAWIAASAYYKLGDTTEEKHDLQYVIKNGNKLALVNKAKARIEDL